MDTPVSGVSLSERPLLARLLEEESYLAQYHAYIQEIVTGWMSTAEEKIDALDALIGEYVKNDATAFYTYEEYQTGLTALRAYIGLRAQSLTGNWRGPSPATSQGQEADPASLIDASGLVLSDMGSMGAWAADSAGASGTSRRLRGARRLPCRVQKTPFPATAQTANPPGRRAPPPTLGRSPFLMDGTARGRQFSGGHDAPDGMELPGTGGATNGGMTPPDGTEMPQGGGDAMGGLSREVMEQALAIIGDSTTLTEEQTQSLLALGLTEEQIAAIQSRAQEGVGRNMGGGRQNGMPPRITPWIQTACQGARMIKAPPPVPWPNGWF